MTDLAHAAASTSPGLRDLLDHNPVVGTPKAGPARFWTTREEKILREHYVIGGVNACLPLLPGRTASAIYGHAYSLELRAPATAKPDFRRQRWTTSAPIDEMIRRAYLAAPTRNAINDLARKVCRPRWWVSKRAVQLGCVAPRFKEPDWTEQELEIVQAAAHLGLPALRRRLKARGFHRSETAIKVKLVREGADRQDPNHFSACGFAKLMGVDGKTVTGWIAKGWLHAKRRGTDRTEAQGGDSWWISRAEARAFIADNAAVVDLRKVDKFWFIDLLAGRAK